MEEKDNHEITIEELKNLTKKKSNKHSNINIEKPNERKIVKYTDEQLQKINKLKKLLIREIGQLEKRQPLYENQIQAGKEISLNFKNKEIFVQLIIGGTQSGKTGTMLSTIKELVLDDEIVIDPKNIFIITGLSSTEWKEQTIDRMPPILHKNIFHSNTLDKFEKKIQDNVNILIIMDEAHIANGMYNRIAGIFQNSGLYGSTYIRDIKILEFSATPNGILYSIEEWRDKAKKVLLKSGKNYTSCVKLLETGKLFQYKPLWYFKDKSEIKKSLYTRLNSLKPENFKNQKEYKDELEKIKKQITDINQEEYNIIKNDLDKWGLECDNYGEIESIGETKNKNRRFEIN